MEFTQGKLNGLVKILNRTYPFIVGVDYEKEDGNDEYYSHDKHTFQLKVDLEILSKIMYLDIDHSYISHSPNDWTTPLWGLELENYEGSGEELYKNEMPIATFITNLIETIFLSPDDDKNIIEVYFKANI
jgi:hypothetical protein